MNIQYATQRAFKDILGNAVLGNFVFSDKWRILYNGDTD